ncbi:hypothetical protein Cgig2_013846 [Carnegiea gigantea]|uniref:Uncharacterized protein n=1 Tax=Carnegiea gigantea TaxID=171969 RepID=A0A9Q1GUC2_9CARY|nr:hypothetical protein Cgig2_013846 [Carnegiea gigantea]
MVKPPHLSEKGANSSCLKEDMPRLAPLIEGQSERTHREADRVLLNRNQSLSATVAPMAKQVAREVIVTLEPIVAKHNETNQALVGEIQRVASNAGQRSDLERNRMTLSTRAPPQDPRGRGLRRDRSMKLAPAYLSHSGRSVTKRLPYPQSSFWTERSLSMKLMAAVLVAFINVATNVSGEVSRCTCDGIDAVFLNKVVEVKHHTIIVTRYSPPHHHLEVVRA